MADVIVQCAREWCRKPFPKGNRSPSKPYYCSPECYKGQRPDTSGQPRLTDAAAERRWKERFSAQEQEYYSTPPYRSRRSMNYGEEADGA